MLDVYWTVYHLDNRRIKIQLDATYYFIMLMLGSTCFGHHYAHHQELTTIAFVYHIGLLAIELLVVGS